MTVLQLHGPMAFRVLQWCHPMLASIKEDKPLYPDDHLIRCSKVDSGPRNHETVFMSRNSKRDGNLSVYSKVSIVKDLHQSVFVCVCVGGGGRGITLR